MLGKLFQVTLDRFASFYHSNVKKMYIYMPGDEINRKFSKLTSSSNLNMMCGNMYAIILCKQNMGSSCLFFQETHFSVCK